MTERILVAYASKHGSTAAVAAKIAAVLEQAGFNSQLRIVDRVEAVDDYDAVVLGSAVYAGQWLREAARFLEQNQDALARVPVWLFSSGPTGEGDPVELLKGWRFPEALQPIADAFGPEDMAVFGGALELDRLNIAEKMIVKGVKAPLGDFRDWEAVEAWAKSIAAMLPQPETEPA